MYQKLSLIAVIFVALVQISGCGENESAEESTVENSASTPASTPAPNPPTTFDGRAEFNKVVRYLDNQAPSANQVRNSWFLMNSGNAHWRTHKDYISDTEFIKDGGLHLKSWHVYAYLENYDWDPIRKEGIVYWSERDFGGNGGDYFRVTFYASGNKLAIGKIEKAHVTDKEAAMASFNVKTLGYNTNYADTDYRNFLQNFWKLVLKSYPK